MLRCVGTLGIAGQRASLRTCPGRYGGFSFRSSTGAQPRGQRVRPGAFLTKEIDDDYAWTNAARADVARRAGRDRGGGCAVAAGAKLGPTGGRTKRAAARRRARPRSGPDQTAH